jgi:hypothetical protein
MKKFVLFILIICICFNAILLSSCQKTAENEEEQETETEEVKLDSNTEIVDLALIDKLEKGMTYEQVKTKLNNPGEPSSRVGYTYAYRLEDGYVAFIKFGGTSPNSKVESLKIEPLVESSCFEYAVNLIETQGKAALQTDFWGTTGIHVGSGEDIHEYYLSDGRIVAVTYEYTGMNGGPVAVSAVVDRIWFEP